MNFVKNLDKLTQEQIEEKKSKLWKYLNEHMGIYTMEEFEEAYANAPKIDLRFLTQKPIEKPIAKGEGDIKND